MISLIAALAVDRVIGMENRGPGDCLSKTQGSANSKEDV